MSNRSSVSLARLAVCALSTEVDAAAEEEADGAGVDDRSQPQTTIATSKAAQ